MPVIVNIDGRIHGERDAVVSVFDHGFLFGEGVYEVLRTYGRTPFRFDAHMARLRASADRIALNVPLENSALASRIRATVDAAALPGDAYVRLLVTRGVGDLVYDPAACPSPTIVIIVKPHVEPEAAVYRDGVRIALVPIVRNHPLSINPLIKSNNLLNNALAMQHAYKQGGYESLMKNHQGELCECAQSNFFLVTDGRVRTPPLDAGLLAGVTRAFVLDLAASQGIPVREEALVEADLSTADEAFLTSTTREIVPVVRVDELVIGDGRPGPITRQLMASFQRATTSLRNERVEEGEVRSTK
jgi:branched-chain amino acid aminotransferase